MLLQYFLNKGYFSGSNYVVLLQWFKRVYLKVRTWLGLDCLHHFALLFISGKFYYWPSAIPVKPSLKLFVLQFACGINADGENADASIWFFQDRIDSLTKQIETWNTYFSFFMLYKCYGRKLTIYLFIHNVTVIIFYDSIIYM